MVGGEGEIVGAKVSVTVALPHENLRNMVGCALGWSTVSGLFAATKPHSEGGACFATSPGSEGWDNVVRQLALACSGQL